MQTRIVLKIVSLALLSAVCISSELRTTSAQDQAAFPLAEPGPYSTGWTAVNYVDKTRDDRNITVRVLYPAAIPTENGGAIKQDTEPDHSGAPYPLILTGINDVTFVDWQLPSHGFVVAAVTDSSPLAKYDSHLLDFPRDIVVALQQLASNPPELLAGIIDTDHTGVLGYSWDGYGALSVSGARADPAYYLDKCTHPALDTLGYPKSWNDYGCSLTNDWDAFVAKAGPELTTSDDGLWQPITDERIRAVDPLAPEGALFFGPRGLAAVDRPTLIISGANDSDNPHLPEAVYIFEHLGTSDRSLISFIGEGHMMVLSQEPFRRMRHFITAFFGYHLQGRQEYADLYTQAFVEQFDNLAWGV